MTIPASSSQGIQTFQLPEFFRVVDDNVNENDQFFAVFAEIGTDVPVNTSCFKQQADETVCLSKRGATRIIIEDNDCE